MLLVQNVYFWPFNSIQYLITFTSLKLGHNLVFIYNQYVENVISLKILFLKII